MYWRFLDEEHPLYAAEAPAKLRHMIPDTYRKMDSILGWTLSQLRRDDILLVLSDHGFASFRRALHLNSWLREHGFMVLRSDARTAGPLFDGVDWSRTAAYALGFGGVYLNLEGREPEGIVQPGDEANHLLKMIKDGLDTWVDPATQASPVSCVYRRDEIFAGPLAEQAPDLYVGMKRGWRVSWQTALGAAPEPLAEDNEKKWSGTHLVDGALLPGVLCASKSGRALPNGLGDVVGFVLGLAATEEPPGRSGND